MGDPRDQIREQPYEESDEEPGEGRNPHLPRLSMRTKVTALGLLSMLGLGVVAMDFTDSIYASWQDTIFSHLPEYGRSIDYLSEYQTSDLIKSITQEPDFFTNWNQVTWTVCLTQGTEGEPGLAVDTWYHHISDGGSGAIPYLVEWVNSTCFHAYPRACPPEAEPCPYPDKPTSAPLIYFYQACLRLGGRYVLSPLKVRWLNETAAVDWEEFREEKDKIVLTQEDGLILHMVLPEGSNATAWEMLILEYGDIAMLSQPLYAVRLAGHEMLGRHAPVYLQAYGIGEGSRIYKWPPLPPGSSLVVEAGTRIVLVTAFTETGDALASDVLVVEPSHP